MEKLVVTLFVACLAVLAGCGPEAPSCNDPKVTEQVIEMVQRAHDAHLNDLSATSKYLASITLEAPRVTEYDEKLKIRKCATSFVVQLPPERISTMNRYIEIVQKQANDPLAQLRALADGLQGRKERPELSVAAQSDIAQWITWNKGLATDSPVRKSLTYQVQKEEGSKDWITSTNVNVVGSIQYLRVATRAQSFFKDAKSEQPTTYAISPVHAEACGEEAMCIKDNAGNVYRTNWFALSKEAQSNIEKQIHSRGKLCLLGVSAPASTGEKDFDGLTLDCQ